MSDKDKGKQETIKSTAEKSKFYAPLNSEQIKAVAELATEVLSEKISNQSSNKSERELAPKNYVRVTDFWTSQQKKEADEHDGNIQEGHKEYSVY